MLFLAQFYLHIGKGILLQNLIKECHQHAHLNVGIHFEYLPFFEYLRQRVARTQAKQQCCYGNGRKLHVIMLRSEIMFKLISDALSRS